MNRSVACAVALAAGLAGCSYPVEPATPLAPTPFNAYTDKVPGKWALLIDADKTGTTLAAVGLRCSQFDYPINLQKSFSAAAEAAFRSVTEDVRLSDHELSKAEIVSQGYSGAIVVRVTDFSAKLATEGAIEARAEADTEIAGTILVLKNNTRTLDASATARGEAQSDAGLACGGVGDAVAAASNQAVRDLARKLAEQFANSHDIRYAAPGSTP